MYFTNERKGTVKVGVPSNRTNSGDSGRGQRCTRIEHRLESDVRGGVGKEIERVYCVPWQMRMLNLTRQIEQTREDAWNEKQMKQPVGRFALANRKVANAPFFVLRDAKNLQRHP